MQQPERAIEIDPQNVRTRLGRALYLNTNPIYALDAERKFMATIQRSDKPQPQARAGLAVAY